MKKSIFLLFSLLAWMATAQVSKSLRIQLELDDSDDKDYQVVSISNKRALMYGIQTKDKADYLLLRVYNESLKMINEKSYAFTSKEYPKYEVNYIDNLFIAMLFHSKSGRFKLFTVDLSTLVETVSEGILMPNCHVDSITQIGQSFFVEADAKAGKHLFVIRGHNAKPTKYVLSNLISRKISDSRSLIARSKSGNEYLILAESMEKRFPNHYLIRFDSLGNKIGEAIQVPQPEEGKKILDISVSKIGANDFILTGTYSTDKMSRSNGIYFSRCINGKFEYTKTYNFLDLDNFTNFLSDEKKIERKKNKKESDGEELNINYRVVVHDIITLNDEYLFLGEFYYPTYRSEKNVTYVDGRRVTSYEKVFDGYRYTHATLASFDNSGNLKWSNCFDMYLFDKPLYVKKCIQHELQNNKLQLIYVNDFTVKSITFEGNKMVKTTSSGFISPDSTDDDIKFTYSNHLGFWYSNAFLGYGYQIIKNEEKERGERKRSVFFISKISY
ncbi:MAG: hypothetical protein MUF42_15975 [Cytophagaceae bacterium]|jgi:hypothetical protein|nr:hypothetical protein [Cytophagaceae bacterium]